MHSIFYYVRILHQKGITKMEEKKIKIDDRKKLRMIFNIQMDQTAMMQHKKLPLALRMYFTLKLVEMNLVYLKI